MPCRAAGRKRWRIVTNGNFTAHQALFGPEGGLEVDGKLLLADVRKPFETWEQSSVLAGDAVVVHEGGEDEQGRGGGSHVATSE